MVEGTRQVSSDCGSLAGLNLATLHHVHQLAVAQYADRGRRRWVSREIRPSAFRGLFILPGEDAVNMIRLGGVLQGHSHSRTHANLALLSRAQIEEEVCGSVEIIERETGARPENFAYPYGRVNAQAAKVVGRVFKHACTTEFRPVDDAARLARLPRLDACYFQEPGLLESWGTERFEMFLRRRRRRRKL